MPFFPDIPTWDNTTLNTQTFLGLNRGQSIADGEMADMIGLSSDDYPVLSACKPYGMIPYDDMSGEFIFPGKVDGGTAGGKFIMCADGVVYVDGQITQLGLSNEEHMYPKQIVGMGTYAYFFPDKKYINLQNRDDYGDMGQKWTPDGDTFISAAMCRKDGRNYDSDTITVSDTAPAEPKNLDLWLDTSGENNVLKQYSTIYSDWIQVATTYIKIQATGIGKGLKEGDVAFLSGAAPSSDPDPDPQPVTVEFSGGSDITMWCQYTITSNGSSYYTREPVESRTITVADIPAGAKITSAKLTYTLKRPDWLVNTFTCNGRDIKPVNPDGGEVVWPYDGEMVLDDITGNGDYSFQFKFLCNRWASGEGNYGGTLTIQDLKMVVTYETGSASGYALSDEDDLKQIQTLNTTNHIYACGDDYIVVAGLLKHQVHLDNTLRCEMRIPDLDYVCEANNRLWGCSYVAIDGKLTNEIRCCALGDHRNWYRFEGTSMDSYTVSLGSDGVFTGAFNLQGSPLFFKEGYLHKISGTMPSNFALSTTRCRGVMQGASRSTAIVNEVLYYQGRHDVMAYDGSVPYAVGEKLGNETIVEACGGAYRDKYYLSRLNADGERFTYVYDTTRQLWHVENKARVVSFSNYNGALAMLTNLGAASAVLCVGSDVGTAATVGAWSATFGVFGYAYERAKYLSRFNIRAQLADGSTMKFEIQYDSDGEWHQAGEMTARGTRTFTLPIIPRRCDHCQIRISGNGNARIFSIARVFEQGGD